MPSLAQLLTPDPQNTRVDAIAIALPDKILPSYRSRTVDFNPLFIAKCLRPSLRRRRPDHHLRAEFPVLGHIPRLLDDLVNHGVIVLETRTQTLGL